MSSKQRLTDLQDRVTLALGMPSGEPEARDYYAAFCELFGRDDITIVQWTGDRGRVDKIFVNDADGAVIAIWTLGRDDHPDRAEVKVEGVIAATFNSLCSRLFWTIDGHLTQRNQLAARRLSRLSPDLLD